MPKNCSLTLQAFDDDRETLLWEVSTDPEHDYPYLCEPEHYGEQEIDLVRGSATIAQLDVLVIDRPQIVGDQSSGWMTEKIVENGVGAIAGRRFRLLRFINDDIGEVVIADGPAGTPRLDSTYAAYRWTVRDTRDTERKLVAFQDHPGFSFYPPGAVDEPWGYNSVDDDYLVPQADDFATGDISGVFDIDGVVSFEISNLSYNTNITQAMIDVSVWTQIDSNVYGGHVGYGQYLKLQLKWRYQGEGEEDWRYHTPGSRFANERGPFFDANFFNEPTPGNQLVRFLFYANTTYGEEAPNTGTTIEFQVLYVGPVDEQYPVHIGNITSGAFLKNLYDGVYSPRDPVTGDIVPSGIRYNEDDLLQMTDILLLRLDEPIKDGRSWAESEIYAPSGWTPALNNDLEISPVTQEPPEDFFGVTTVDDLVSEPTPDWNAGETIFNDMTFTYYRYYPDVESDAIDLLSKRTIVIEFRDEVSIKRHGIQDVTYDTGAFSAVGDDEGNGLDNGEVETGLGLSQDRYTHVFIRYKDGAQVVNIPVRRSFTTEIRAGSFIIADLSWIPDYILQRRGGIFGGQVLSVKDLDCAWRTLLIEEILPLTRS